MDVDDIILNVLGTMVGFLLLKLTSIEKIIGFSSIQKQLN
ncbi:hypothetical protein LIT25_20435 [Bacillus sp. F19]|nr:hypothetical protein LIT25_20435 [Bacillus sp. F19]